MCNTLYGLSRTRPLASLDCGAAGYRPRLHREGGSSKEPRRCVSDCVLDGVEGLPVREVSGGYAKRGRLVSQVPWVPGAPYRASMVSTAWSTALVMAESSGSQRAGSIRGQNT